MNSAGIKANGKIKTVDMVYIAIAAALIAVCSWISIPMIIALTVGLAVCYAFGTAWFMYVYIRNTGAIGVMTVLSWCVLPFIILDIVKMILALVISKRVRMSVFSRV